MLLDESTNGLDEQMELQILQGVKRHCQKIDIICVLISHRNSCRVLVDEVLQLGELQNF